MRTIGSNAFSVSLVAGSNFIVYFFLLYWDQRASRAFSYCTYALSAQKSVKWAALAGCPGIRISSFSAIKKRRVRRNNQRAWVAIVFKSRYLFTWNWVEKNDKTIYGSLVGMFQTYFWQNIMNVETFYLGVKRITETHATEGQLKTLIPNIYFCFLVYLILCVAEKLLFLP